MSAPLDTIALPRRGPAIHRSRAIAVAALCWTAFAVMVWLVTTGRSGSLDSTGLMFWRDADLKPVGPELLLEMVRDVTSLGGVVLRNLIAIGAVVALLFLHLKREAVLLALTVVLAWVVEYAIKLMVGRPRPEIVPHLTEAGGASFPSGHSFNSAVVFIAVALAFATLSSRQSVRITIVAAAVVLSLTVAWSRVWLGVHFPTDVTAGWLGGAGWAFLATALLQGSAGKVANQVPSAAA